MARGKHGVRAEARSFENLQAEVAALEATLKKSKADLSDSRSEVIRLRAIEAVFDGTKDVIAELDSVKRELSEVHGRNFVFKIRLDSWAEAIMKESNREFLRLSPNLWADFVELGYFEPVDGDNRNMRRAYATKGKFQKAANIGRDAKLVG
jgi:hypothetical protein